MHHFLSKTAIPPLLFMAVGVASAEEVVSLQKETPLDRYVRQADPAYAWKVVHRRERAQGKELVIELTSQAWRTKDEVSPHLWKHWLVVCVPHDADARTALLFITGGRNGGPAPQGCSDLAAEVALGTGSVVAELRMVPNQPLTVNGDGAERYEDDLLARSWNMCLETRDPTWIAQLPMAKSAVKAMDAIQECLPEEAPRLSIERFVVAGASKRGWTTWLTAAVDQRVAAIAPIVIDILNIDESMRHHHAVYGFWSEALGDYQRQGLADKIASPECQQIIQIVDPFEYRDRCTMPKCLINATGDEFFLPDSSRYYFDELLGEKHLCYTPNTGHSLTESNALDTLIAFHHCMVRDVERPSVECSLSADGKLTARCSIRPTAARLFQATNPNARDFRYPVIRDAFKAQPLVADPDGTYSATLTPPASGWTATLAQFEFNVGAARPFRITSPVWVTPDTEPFAKTE